VAKRLGILLLALIFAVFLSVSTLFVLELGDVSSTQSFVTRTLFLEKEEVALDAVFVINEKDIEEERVEKVQEEINEIIPIVDIPEVEIPEEEVVEKLIKNPPAIPFLTDDYYSSNMSVRASEREIDSVSSFYETPALPDGKFAVYSPEFGVLDSRRFRVVKEFDATASTSYSNPLGADTFGIVENSQLQIKRRLVMARNITDNFKFIYTIKNIQAPFSKDNTRLKDIKIKKKVLRPALVDLDGDGDLDLVIGETVGRLFYFENTGTTSDFNFVLRDDPDNGSDSNLFQSVRANVNMAQPWFNRASPNFADLDNDGDFDLILGNSGKYIDYFENIGSATTPVWQQDGSMFSILNNSFARDVAFADLDNDGDFDMVVVFSTHVDYYENTGSATSPVWTLFDLFNQTNSNLTNGDHSNIEVSDYDGDGDFDVLMNGHRLYEQTLVIENSGTLSNPVFGDAVDLKIHHGEMFYEAAYQYERTLGIAAGDLDGDGKDDLVIGNNNGTLSFYSSKPADLTDVYFYEIPLFDFTYSLEPSMWYDYAQDAFVMQHNFSLLNSPRSSIMMFGNRQSARHGIQTWEWYSGSYFEPNNICGFDILNNGEDLYWTDGELNGLDSYDFSSNVYTFFSCTGTEYNTSDYRAAVLGFNMGNFSKGEEKTIEITYKIGGGVVQRKKPDLTVSNIVIKNNNVTLSLDNLGDSTVVDPELHLVDVFEDGVVNDLKVQTNITLKEQTSVNISFVFNVPKEHKVLVIVDPDNKVDEEDESNNLVEKENHLKNVFIDVQENFADVFKEYLIGKLDSYNIVDSAAEADIELVVGGLNYNDLTLKKRWGKEKGYIKFYFRKGFLPYNGLVNVLDDKVVVRGVNIDGVIAALKYLDFSSLENSKKFVGKKDEEGLRVFDFLRSPSNQPFLYQNNSGFESVVRQALFGKYVEENVSVKTLQGVELRLRHLAPENSLLLREYLGLPNFPVVMAGGLWSDITTWQSLGQELSDDGRDVWLAEITGGPNTECDVCNDYTYQDLVDYHVPAVVGGVLAYANNTRIQWVGHSNGGRSALDFLSAYSSTGLNPAGLYWNGTDYDFDSFGANVIETYVGVGVPGAFNDPSPFGECMKIVGQQIFDDVPFTMNHLSQKYLGMQIREKNLLFSEPTCEALGFFLKDDNKISKDLTYQYFLWINNTADAQPGNAFTLDNATIIYGTRDHSTSTDSDLVVPVGDSSAIYNNINSVNKSLIPKWVMHHEMTTNDGIKSIVKEVVLR